MEESNKKKHGIFFKIMMVLLTIVLIIAIVIVGGYFYLKNSLGFDITKIKNALELLNKSYSTSAIIDQGFNKENTENGFAKLFGEDNNVYIKSSNSIDSDEFNSAVLQDCLLTNKEFASILNAYIKNLISSEEFKFFSLKQIKFSNLQKSELTTELNIDFTFEIDIVKSNMGTDSIFNLILDKIPNKLFLTSGTKLIYSNENCFEYSTENQTFKINNLTYNQTDEIFEALTFLGSKNEIIEDLNSLFYVSIFGDDSEDGFFQSLNEIKNFDFVEIDDEIVLEIKKV